MNTISSKPLKQRFSRKFVKDTSGNIAIIAALSVIPIISVLGLAVDFQLAVTKKNLVQQTLDATMIAAARERQAGISNDNLENFVDEYFNNLIRANAPSLSCDDRTLVTGNNTEQVFDVNLTFDQVGQGMNGTVNCTIATTLSGIVGRKEVNFLVSSGSTFGIGLIDVAMVFDVSGSMRGSRIAGLKSAATTAVEALIPDNPVATTRVRISLVPYDHTVNVGRYFTDFTGLRPNNRTYPREEPINLRSRFTDIKLAQARNDLDNLNQINDAINQRLQTDIDRLNEQINDLNDDIDDLRDDININNRRIARLQSILSTAQNSNFRQNLRNRINNFINDNNRIQSDIRALEQRRDNLIRNRERLERQQANPQNAPQIRSLEARIRDLENGGGLNSSEVCNSRRQQNCIVDGWMPSTGVESGTCVFDRGSNAFAFTNDDPVSGDIDTMMRGQANFWFTGASDEKKLAAHFGLAQFTTFDFREPDRTALNDLYDRCQPNEISLLTDNKNRLIQDIGRLQVSGGTTTGLGLAVGWYTISPEWGSIFPDANTSHSYTEPSATKVVILMTDGVSQHWMSEGTHDNWELPDVPGRDVNAPETPAGPNAAEERMLTLCDNMKARGIAIYTVAFSAPQRAANHLRSCASTGKEFFQTADNNNELEDVFAQIANSISDLRIQR